MFTGDGRTVVSGGDDSTLAFTDVTDPAAARTVASTVDLGGIAFSLAASPDGRYVAAGIGSAGLVRIWDVSDPSAPTVVGELPTRGGASLQVYALAYSPDGRSLAVGSADRTLRFADVSDPADPVWLGAPVTGPSDYVWAVKYAADGRRLAMASADGLIRVYDVVAPGQVRLFAVLSAAGRVPLYSVAFSPDSSRVAAGGRPAAVFQWSLDPEAVQERICALAGETVTRDDWTRYVPSVRYAPPC